MLQVTENAPTIRFIMGNPRPKDLFLRCTNDPKLTNLIRDLPKHRTLNLQTENDRLVLQFDDKDFKCYTNGFRILPNQRYVFDVGVLIEFDGDSYELELKEAEIATTKRKREEIPSAFDALMKRAKKTAEPGWESIDNDSLLIFTPKGVESRKKIAGFDIDGTITKTKSGATFPKDKNDWVFLNPRVASKLRECHGEGYKVVFFTNQAGLTTTKRVQSFKEKIAAILAELDVPIQVFISLGRTIYRKPVTGMWTCLAQEKNDSVAIEIADSFFVGDAAGRKKPDGKSADHSNSDLLFAYNIGLKFFTPEEYFLSQSQQAYNLPDFDPRAYSPEDPDKLKRRGIVPIKKDMNKDIKWPGEVEVILMVGMQGSGKSHFVQSVLVPQGYKQVNRDTLGTWQKCVKMMEQHLKDNLSVVIDNTNGSVSARERYISVAKSKNIPVRCFVMTTSYEHCKHNNRYRELTDKSHAQIGEMLINQYKKEFQEPKITEGFQEIVQVHFDVDRSGLQELYWQFLT